MPDETLTLIQETTAALRQRKDERSRLEGERAALLNRLQDEFQCKTLEEAKVLRARLEEVIAQLGKDVAQRTAELQQLREEMAL